jgi:hypothetical protein
MKPTFEGLLLVISLALCCPILPVIAADNVQSAIGASADSAVKVAAVTGGIEQRTQDILPNRRAIQTEVEMSNGVRLSDTSNQSLSNIKKIFVASLGADSGSELIRQKVINRLVKSKILIAVEAPDNADATLIGAGMTSQSFSLHGSSNLVGGTGTASVNGTTHSSAQLVVRLVGKRGEILWTNEVNSKGRSVGKALYAVGLATALVGAPFVGLPVLALGGACGSRDPSSNVADQIVNGLIKAIKMDRQPSPI